jgi:hypothetical protein
MTDTTTPQAAPAAAPQSNDEAIKNFANGFLESVERDDDPDQMDEQPEDQQAETPQDAEAQGTEGEEAENATPESEEVPVVEVEVDGEKYQIPEKLKGRLMADKDYRQKTMALAESRKVLEQLTSQAQQLATQAQQMAPYHAQLYAMDNRAQQLSQALDNPALRDDPIEFNRVQGELAILLRNRDSLAANLGNANEHFAQQASAIQMQKLAQEAPKLYEEHPQLQEPENQKALVKYLQSEGADEQALGYINFSVFGTKLAWKALQYDRMVKSQSESKAKLQEKVQKLSPVSSTSRAPDRGAQEKQLQKDWKKGGGKIHDPAFSMLLRNKLRGK